MVLEGLDLVEVGSLTLREAVLAVQLQLSSDDRVLTPAVHVEGSLGKDERTSIRDGRLSINRSAEDTSVLSRLSNISSTRHLEETRGINVGISTRGSIRSREGVDSVRKSINGISVVERLSTKGLVEKTVSVKG